MIYRLQYITDCCRNCCLDMQRLISHVLLYKSCRNAFIYLLDTHFTFHSDYAFQSKLQNENTCLCLASFRSTLIDKVSKKQSSHRQLFYPKPHENQLQNKEQNQSCCFNHRNEQFWKIQTTVSLFFGLVTESRKRN